MEPYDGISDFIKKTLKSSHLLCLGRTQGEDISVNRNVGPH